MNLPMLNKQPPAKKTEDENGDLDVVKVWRTIQGEGPFTGTPAVFVRLADCNLQCPLCDTDYTSFVARQSPDDLLSAVQAKAKNGLVVITGGEPYRQNFGPFVRKLIWAGYQIQVETNGTLFQDDVPLLPITIVVSPKTPVVNDWISKYAAAYKYVLQYGFIDESDGLPTSVLGNGLRPARPSKGKPVYVQPLDEGDPNLNKINLEATVAYAMQFGYRVGLQVHKLLGLE